MEGEKEDIRKKTFSLESILDFLSNKFSLKEDGASQTEVVENIRKGVEFKGTNLWVLIFATFVASLGLNINSTAVIIGAMLISPLMGPIMGIGLSVGINDFELLKKSLRNFAFMALVSILTSALYFLISPLTTAQSELLARTTPTTFDVLIAFFGGLAGMVAQSRKDRTSTVIPGVAIATALMPPLCTAGYGLATMQLTYFAGAFYLFFINAVFIAIATYIVVQFLKYRKKEFLDKKRGKKVKRYMLVVSLLTLIPSIFIAYGLIQRSAFETIADKYVSSVFDFPETLVINSKKEYRPKGKESYIDIVLLGEPLSDDAIKGAEAQLAKYGLRNTRLIVHQSGESVPQAVDVTSLQSAYRDVVASKNQRISELERHLKTIHTDTVPAQEITREITALENKLVNNVTLARSLTYNASGEVTDTVLIALLKLNDKKTLSEVDKERIISWLKVRTKTNNVKLYTE